LGEASSASSSENPEGKKEAPKDDYADYIYREKGGFTKFGFSLLALGVIGLTGYGIKQVW